jgi:hypothetical protein
VWSNEVETSELVLNTDSTLPAAKSELLHEGFQELTLDDGNVNCNFRVNFTIITNDTDAEVIFILCYIELNYMS